MSNTEKKNAATKKWRDANKDTPEYKERKRASAAKYWENVKADPEKYTKQRKRIKTWVEDNPEKAKTSHNKKPGREPMRWGDKSWEGMYEEQDGRCRGCFEPLLPGYTTHKAGCGKVRNLLCRLCNLAIGQTKDSPETLRRLADLVEHHANFECASMTPKPIS